MTALTYLPCVSNVSTIVYVCPAERYDLDCSQRADTVANADVAHSRLPHRRKLIRNGVHSVCRCRSH